MLSSESKNQSQEIRSWDGKRVPSATEVTEGDGRQSTAPGAGGWGLLPVAGLGTGHVLPANVTLLLPRACVITSAKIPTSINT